jgi:hypothetical protein
MPSYVPAGNCCNHARARNPSAGRFPRSTESSGGRWWSRCTRSRQTCSGCAPTCVGCMFTAHAWSAAGCLAWARWALAKDRRRPRTWVPVPGLGSMGAGGEPEKTRHTIAEVRKRAVGLAIGGAALVRMNGLTPLSGWLSGLSIHRPTAIGVHIAHTAL